MVKQHKGLRKHAIIWGAGLFLCAAEARAAEIAQVSYGSLTGTEFVSFGNVTAGGGAGTNYDGMLIIDGVGFGEHFNGQTVTASGNFDQLSGSPSGALNLVAGAPGQNLAALQSPAGVVLSGIGPAGYPVFDAIGEGAVSLLFSTDQSEFGFLLAGGHGGNAYISFFRSDGSLIEALTLGSLPLVSRFGFSRVGGVQDIRGVSIWNDDPTGFGLTAFRHDVASAVPEPGTWAMMLIGFGMVGASMRRLRRRARCSPLITDGSATAMIDTGG